MPLLQEWIHKLEVGPGFRYLRILVGCLALFVMVLIYNTYCYHNFNTQEAMDAAQVGRNLAEGRGYTTYFIRPFSVYLVKKRNEAKYGAVPPSADADYCEVNQMHPDLANAPFYPCVLAAWMKTYPAILKGIDWVRQIMPAAISRRLPEFNDSPAGRLWEKDGHFWWYPPDFFIAVLNEALFFAVIVLTFFLTRRLFDKAVAWLTALLLLGCELMWRFAVSGQSTMLLLLIFVAMVFCLALVERESREPKWGSRGLLLLCAGVGLLLGIGMLTRYTFGSLIFPVWMFILLFTGNRRIVHCTVILLVFLALLGPWVYRNYQISGKPFGTAGYAALEGGELFPSNKLERSLSPRLQFNPVWPVIHKLGHNARQIVQAELPALGGPWVMPFFLVGLMLGFRNPTLNRLRYFLLACILTLIVAQAVGRTHLSDESPDVNSENLLVLLTPFVLVYGVSLFYVLLDQVTLPLFWLRYAIMGTYGLVVWLPLICLFLPPKSNAIAYPPYDVRFIRQQAVWMKENEMLMSDVPWAVAWYEHRQCAWLTLNAQDEFFSFNDYVKPVSALYLTPLTMDGRFVSDWLLQELSWGSFVIDCLESKSIPPTFPLRHSPVAGKLLQSQLFLTDWDRWRRPGDATSPP